MHCSTSRRQGTLLLSSLVPSHPMGQVNKLRAVFLCGKSIDTIPFISEYDALQQSWNGAVAVADFLCKSARCHRLSLLTCQHQVAGANHRCSLIKNTALDDEFSYVSFREASSCTVTAPSRQLPVQHWI